MGLKDHGCKGSHILIRSRTRIDDEGVLSLGPGAIVRPTLAAASIAVSRQIVVVRSSLVYPTHTQSLQDKIAEIEMPVVDVGRAAFVGDENGVFILPGAAERCHLHTSEILVERQIRKLKVFIEARFIPKQIVRQASPRSAGDAAVPSCKGRLIKPVRQPEHLGCPGHAGP